ncbi:peptidoglycan DD-metalloendopeptidase family protein [Fusibacter sp. JL216-2]|uniref:M23 family metallopeptidase n=1 Tax=Fusibacter sp. JL216-2 TaxID=3071453 RepID=UPI003D347D79
MKNKDYKDQFLDKLAWFVAALASPFYGGYQSLKRSKRNKSYYQGARSNRYDFKYKINRFIEDNQRPVYAGVALAVLAVVAFTVTSFIPNGTPSGVNTSSAQALQAPEASEKVSVEALKASSAVAELNGQLDGESQELAQEMSEEDILYEKLMTGMEMTAGISVRGYEIRANDIPVAYFGTREEAEYVLDSLKNRYKNEEEVEYIRTYFQENVEITKAYKPVGKWTEFKDPDTVLEYIVRGTNEQKRHIVEKGENFWVIAKGYGIPVNDLVKANPEVVPERLQIGQQISLVVPRPLISVYTVESAEYNDDIQYDIEYEDTASMFQGEYRTKVKGDLGERFVEAEVYRVNGLEVGRIVTKEEILEEPTTKVVYRGTKDPPPRKGTGVFAKPTSRGYITSGFGWRWGRKHTGIDVGIPTGTPVTAADGGVVIFSGTKGGYGKCVIIDHGANMKTLYAHNSKLYVRKGDKVFKGQTIAASGNTGRSTGPHLHFEIQKNGVPVNPTGYISY